MAGLADQIGISVEEMKSLAKEEFKLLKEKNPNADVEKIKVQAINVAYNKNRRRRKLNTTKFYGVLIGDTGESDMEERKRNTAIDTAEQEYKLKFVSVDGSLPIFALNSIGRFNDAVKNKIISENGLLFDKMKNRNFREEGMWMRNLVFAAYVENTKLWKFATMIVNKGVDISLNTNKLYEFDVNNKTPEGHKYFIFGQSVATKFELTDIPTPSLDELIRETAKKYKFFVDVEEIDEWFGKLSNDDVTNIRRGAYKFPFFVTDITVSSMFLKQDKIGNCTFLLDDIMRTADVDTTEIKARFDHRLEKYINFAEDSGLIVIFRPSIDNWDSELKRQSDQIRKLGMDLMGFYSIPDLRVEAEVVTPVNTVDKQVESVEKPVTVVNNNTTTDDDEFF